MGQHLTIHPAGDVTYLAGGVVAGYDGLLWSVPLGGPAREPAWSAAFTVGASVAQSSTVSVREPSWQALFAAAGSVSKATPVEPDYITVFHVGVEASKLVVREPAWSAVFGFFPSVVAEGPTVAVSAPAFMVSFSAGFPLVKRGGVPGDLTLTSWKATTRQYPGGRSRRIR